MIKASDLSIVLAHAYIFGAWFQNDLLQKSGMLLMALIFLIYYTISSKNEFRMRMLELKYQERKNGKN